MSILKPSPISTKQFTYVKEEGLLVAEASSLPPFGRVYDDACDEGLTLVSHKTGREVVYVVNSIGREHMDPAGDLLYWDLVPARASESGLPTVRVFND